MRRFSFQPLAIAAVTMLLATPAAADCGKVVDELTAAVSGKLTMSTEKKVAMLRMTTRAYDDCMAGDLAASNSTRDMIMAQIRKHLGSPQ